MVLTTNQRKAIVDGLIHNGCGCWTEEDRKMLDGFSDQRITKLAENAETAHQAGEVVEAVRNGFGGKFKTLALNAMPAALAKAQMAEEEAPDEEEVAEAPVEEEEEEMVAVKPVANQKRATFEQLLNAATPEQKAVWNSAVKIHKEAKDHIIQRLVANVHAQEKKVALYNRLKDRSIEELQDMLDMIPQPTQNRREEELPSWLGASGFHQQTNNAQEDLTDDLLDLPTMNYSKDGVKV